MTYDALGMASQEQSRLTDRENFLRGCASAFWEIDVVRASSWNGHIPFMFILFELMRPRRYVELGCHDGGSLFAACQAKARLHLDTECIAVDTWTGDAHSGFYGPEVLSNLTADLAAAGFYDAVLKQSLFDDAVADFEDGSIDVLLIDGLHTYEAVKHDFETWFPKVAEGGVVLLHDTLVHERDFGVWKLWEQLEVEHETFEFSHAHGLGVILKPGDDRVHQFFTYVRENVEVAAHLQSLLETVAERSVSHRQLGPANERATIWHDRADELEQQLKSAPTVDEQAALVDEIRSLRKQLLQAGDELAVLRVENEASCQKADALRSELLSVGDSRARERSELVNEVEELRRQLLEVGDERTAIRSHYERMKVVRLMRRYWALRNR